MSYKKTIEIEGPDENSVESFVHAVMKNAHEGSRYGVKLKVTTVETDQSQDVEFTNNHVD